MQEVERVIQMIERLNDGQILAVHRAVARIAHPIWRRVYPGHWEMGMAASRAKWKRETGKRQDVA